MLSPMEIIWQSMYFIYLQHIVVYRKGFMYKLDVYDTQGKVLQAYNIEKLLKWVIEDADLDTGNNYKINTQKD